MSVTVKCGIMFSYDINESIFLGYVLVKYRVIESCGFEEIPEALLKKGFYRKRKTFNN